MLYSRCNILQVLGAQTDLELRDCFDEPEFEWLLLETGYILSSVIDYHCIVKVKAAMDQFIECLNLGGVLKSLKLHGDLFKPYFCACTSQLTAGKVIGK